MGTGKPHLELGAHCGAKGAISSLHPIGLLRSAICFACRSGGGSARLAGLGIVPKHLLIFIIALHKELSPLECSVRLAHVIKL